MGTHHPIRKTVAPEPTVIPDKLYFRIGDVARLCQVPAYVLRFWETEFPSLKPNKGGTGQRLYRKRDVEMALRIKSLLYDQGYTIPGARQVFKAEARAQEPGDSNQAAEVSVPPVPASQAIASPAPLDRGEEIRLRAQQQGHLQALRQDLLTLLAQLNSPVAGFNSPVAELNSPVAGFSSPVAQLSGSAAVAGLTDQPGAAAGLRPVANRSPDTPPSGLRLVVEPRPRSARSPSPSASLQPSELQQRDLFATDTAEAPE